MPSKVSWGWHSLKTFKTTASNKLWEKLRGKAGGQCGDEWFYYQFWVAGRDERRRMRRLWSEKLRWVEELLRGSGKGESGDDQKGCPLTGVVTIEGVLRRLYGIDWEVPRGNVRSNTSW
jgi:hypothetical protein